jgi:hypothetical protein
MAILKTANFSGSNGSHFSIRLDYSLEQNQIANTSKIVYSLYFVTDRYGSGYGSAISGYINGANVGSCTSIGTNSTILIGTKTENVTHNNDGTKSVDYSASMSGSWTGLGSASLSGTLTLPKIDRLAFLDETSLPTSITDESSIKFSYSNPAGFKVKPVITITQDSLISIEGDYITTSPYTWNWLTTDANKKLVYDCVRNSPNATARLKLNTYDSSGNFIGSTMSATTIPFTLVNCSPAINLTCNEQNAKVKSIVGSKLILLNNVSSLKVDASVATKKNATIAEVLIQDKKVVSPYSTTFIVTGDSGDYKVNASVRDSRQLIVTGASSTYQLIDYRPVSIDSYSFKRENPTSNKIKLNAKITYWGITLNGTANAPIISYSTDGSSYITIPSSAYTIDNTNHLITINNYVVPTTLNYQNQGTYYLKVVDKFTDDVENEIVTRGIPTTEKGKDVFQVNGRLIIADENRQNPVDIRNLVGSAPIGQVSDFAGENIPDGWLKCDGRELPRIDYAELFNAIGTTYGSGNGSTTFNIPNIEGRVVVAPDENQEEFATLGQTGGSKYMQEHDHYIKDAGYDGGSSGDVLNFHSKQVQVSSYMKTGKTGTGDSGNLQPYIVLYKIIKATNTTSTISKNVEAKVIDSLDGTSTIDAPSVRAVKDALSQSPKEVYSTSEQVIGTWLGKPLYRKVINFGSLPNTTTKNVDHGISNVEQWVTVRGLAMNSDKTALSIPATNSDNNTYALNISVTKTQVRVQASIDRTSFSAYTILEYTKTS